MLGRQWPRFALEACFLVAVAVAAGLLQLATRAIVGVMLGAYLAVVVLEWAMFRTRAEAEPGAQPALEPAAQAAGALLDVTPAPPTPERERLDAIAPPEPEPEPEPGPEPEPEEAPELPTAEPQPAEPQPAAEEREPAEPQPAAEEREPESAPQLVAVAAAEQEPEQEPEPEPEQEPEVPEVARLPLPSQPQEWNIWELERAVQGAAVDDPVREEEWSYLLVYLREFASPDGVLPADFDALVRESFGDVLARAPR